MDGSHPSDIELLELVEGELDADAEASLRSHLAVCRSCAADVERLERAREALRAAPLLELPPGRLEAMLGRLAAQEREPGELRGFLRSRRRLLALLTPAAAALVAVVVVSTTGGNGRPGEEAAPVQATAEAAATEAPQVQAAPAEEAGEALDQAVRAPVAMVAGPPQEVVRLLEEAGFDARRVGDTVEVTGAAEEEVARALDDRADGPVAVVVLQP